MATIDITKSEWYQRIGEKLSPSESLKLFRRNRGLTQKALAECFGKSRHFISRLENGAPINPGVAERLAQVLDCPAVRFIKREV